MIRQLVVFLFGVVVMYSVLAVPAAAEVVSGADQAFVACAEELNKKMETESDVAYMQAFDDCMAQHAYSSHETANSGVNLSLFK